MKCIIVDDEVMAIEVIASHIKQIKDFEIVGTYNNAPGAFIALQQHKVDILFLDIQMPQMSGLNLLENLKNPPYVILTTAFREFALESYDFNIIDYLLKPISFERFMKALGKIYAIEQKINTLPLHPIKNSEPLSEEAAFIYVRCDRQFIKILLEDISYIESLKNHIRIITSKGTFITLLSISEIERKMPPQSFIRLHRSYIVASSKIITYNTTSVTLSDKNKTIPIGQLYKISVLKYLNKNCI